MSSSSSRGTSPRVYYSYTDRASSPFRRTNFIDTVYHKFAPYIPKVLGGLALITAGYLGHKYNNIKNAVSNTYQNAKQSIQNYRNNNANKTTNLNNSNISSHNATNVNNTNHLNNFNKTNSFNKTKINSTVPVANSAVPNQSTYRLNLL